MYNFVNILFYYPLFSHTQSFHVMLRFYFFVIHLCQLDVYINIARVIFVVGLLVKNHYVPRGPVIQGCYYPLIQNAK
jgi:hypothetical protein